MRLAIQEAIRSLKIAQGEISKVDNRDELTAYYAVGACDALVKTALGWLLEAAKEGD